MVGIHLLADIYAIFRFEPMYALSVGVSRLLKERLINLLSDDEATTAATRKTNSNPEAFKQIKGTAFKELKKFLRKATKRS